MRSSYSYPLNYIQCVWLVPSFICLSKFRLSSVPPQPLLVCGSPACSLEPPGTCLLRFLILQGWFWALEASRTSKNSSHPSDFLVGIHFFGPVRRLAGKYWRLWPILHIPACLLFPPHIEDKTLACLHMRSKAGLRMKANC